MSRFGWLVAAVIAAAGVAAAATADGPPTRETAYSGLIARLPHVGALTWRCDREKRFSTLLRLPKAGATVYVGLVSDGRRIWRHRRVDPAPAPKRTIVGPFRADRRQGWTIRYHHKPASLVVGVRLQFTAGPPVFSCRVSRSFIDVRDTTRWSMRGR